MKLQPLNRGLAELGKYRIVYPSSLGPLVVSEFVYFQFNERKIMLKSQVNLSSLAMNLALALLLSAFAPTPVQAIDIKKKAIQIAVCGGGAYGGFKLGEKIAEFEAKKLKLASAEAQKHRQAIQIGTAAALCGAGYFLTGTVYGNLSKRDREAREKEMDAALADANPGTRNYVLPDSKLTGILTTETAQMEGNKECRWQVDVLSKDGEPARAKFCRKSPKGKYDLDIF